MVRLSNGLGCPRLRKGCRFLSQLFFLFLRYDFHPQTLSLRAIDVLFQNIERWIQYLRFENMPCNRICNKVGNLKPYHIVSFGDKVKSLHVRLQPFRSYPILCLCRAADCSSLKDSCLLSSLAFLLLSEGQCLLLYSNRQGRKWLVPPTEKEIVHKHR